MGVIAEALNVNRGGTLNGGKYAALAALAAAVCTAGRPARTSRIKKSCVEPFGPTQLMN